METERNARTTLTRRALVELAFWPIQYRPLVARQPRPAAHGDGQLAVGNLRMCLGVLLRVSEQKGHALAQLVLVAAELEVAIAREAKLSLLVQTVHSKRL